MDIRVITYGYNEIKLLPLKKAWCDHHNLQLVYFDNESTDGSREWAIENNVFAGDIKTDGAFDIVHIMDQVEEYRQNHHYDWTLLAGVDLFLAGTESWDNINEAILKMVRRFPHADGFSCNYAMMCRNTKPAGLPWTQYNQCLNIQKEMLLIAKGSRKLSIDNIECDNIERITNLWWINFGHTKSRQERLETFERRKLAWSRGLNKGYGNHYNTLKSYNFELPNQVTENIVVAGAGVQYAGLCELLLDLSEE